MAEAISGRAIWFFYPLNYSFHVPWLFPFQDAKFPVACGAGRDKVQFLMRRQHQMVAFAAPCHMIAKSASVRRFPFFPLDWDVFIESGHCCLRGCILCQQPVESKEPLKAASQRFPPAAKFFSGSPIRIGHFGRRVRSLSMTTFLKQPLSYLSSKFPFFTDSPSFRRISCVFSF
jgi:hypothetical protein